MKLLKILLISMALALSPIRAVIHTAFALIIIDLISGIIAARLRGEKIESSKLKQTVLKVFLYEIAIILAFLTEKNLTGDGIPLCKIVSTFVGMTEFTSILENLASINHSRALGALAKAMGKIPTEFVSKD